MLTTMGGYVKVGDLRSLASVLIYLNEAGADFEGGSTRFINAEDPTQFVEVTPKVGRVVVFEHRLFHSGSPLIGEGGQKLAVRTDLLFPVDAPPYAQESAI